MPKITLRDGRKALLIYRGATEDERIESALLYHDLQEITGRMQNRGDLTPTMDSTLIACMQFVVDIQIIPEEGPGREDQGRPAAEVTPGGPGEQAHDEGAPIPRRRGVR